MGDASQWNVISAGPSRHHLEYTDLIPGAPTVTVNRAVDVIDRGIHVDFAMFADPPHALAKVLDISKYLVPPIQVWCPAPALYHHGGLLQVHDMITQWEPHLPLSVGIRTTPFGLVKDGEYQRYMFSLLGCLERVLMFRPKHVRLLCADMMGSWAPGLTEAECEEQQSQQEEARRGISKAQKALNDSRGKDGRAAVALKGWQEKLADIQKRGDPGVFKRWEYERKHLRALEGKAFEMGCTFEYVSPKMVVA